ncbi:uncharacterized protein MONBRDRAFT_1116, partial [Monosiga brevicollis MX1]
VTLDLLRKRAEHNNKELSTLEEVSLHQENLEKIELLDTACRQLQILYLQNNIIGKIENLQRLKELRYINLALNNIVRIEGLQGCECLEKVDLTVNFITDVTTVTSLRANRNLRELYLTGNPCTQFKGYREYVISVLPQLQLLDGKAVTRSERILALQDFERTQSSIRAAIAEVGRAWLFHSDDSEEKKKKKEATFKLYFKTVCFTSLASRVCRLEVPELSDEAQKQFWEEETEHTPQARFMMQKKQEAFQRAEDMKRNPPPPKKERRFFRDDGTPLNINEGDWDFRLLGQEYDSQALELDFPCYRHLDTSQLEVDVQPYHVRVVVKGRVFQLHLPEEVKPDSSSAKRSMVTGHLLISMPKVKPVLTARART